MDTDRARAEVNKLKRKVKKEKRGAMRELRRDTEFIEQEKGKVNENDARSLMHIEQLDSMLVFVFAMCFTTRSRKCDKLRRTRSGVRW